MDSAVKQQRRQLGLEGAPSSPTDLANQNWCFLTPPLFKKFIKLCAFEESAKLLF
jgi:hypothetical protein